MIRRAAALALALAALLGGCDGTRSALGLAAAVRDGVDAVELRVPGGARVSARLVPALEWPDGRVVRLAHGRIDADSAYFTEAPWTPRAGLGRGRVLVRASVCHAGEQRCRSLAAELRLP